MPCWTWTRYLGTVRQSACNRPTNKNDTASILARWPGPREAGTLRQDWPCCQPSSRLASQTCSAMLLSQPRFLQIFSASSVWEWKAQYVDQIKRQRLGANCDWSCERFTFDPGLSRRVREIVVRPTENCGPWWYRPQIRLLPSRNSIFRRKRRRRQSVGVKQIDYRRVCPSVPDVLRLRHACIAGHDSLAVDARDRAHKAAIVSGNLKPLENASLGNQSIRRVIEPDTHGFTVGRCLSKQRAGILHVFAIGQGPRSQGEARAHRLFAGRMDIVRIADIDGHRHRRIRHRKAAALCFADDGPCFGCVRCEAGNLHEEKWKIPLMPLSAPVGNQGRKDFGIHRSEG